ncbi:hypothetical protein Mgra_00002363 [Meloidogyne graminicola]|uniref:Uncharacterized protein n=1 Tax=Meloidogyne graminicola TaxID=189291 RepID=A0A8S9ZWZ3_9BILA|nr:hypothetical protein Mgra_00002363 [Meloidogyne graminicola]
MSSSTNNLFSFLIKFLKILIFIICIIYWVFQSLPIIKIYLDGKQIEQKKIYIANELTLPHLLFCNRFPFTQAGLSSLGQQFNRDFVLSYLRQWLDPSIGVNSPEDSLAIPLNEQDKQQAEQTIAQLLPNGRLKQRLEQLMPQCQEMVSSCVIGSRQMGGYDCCRMVQPWLATSKGGICWPFIGNLSSIQNPMESPRGMQITFQISRNSFLSSSLSVHPGIDIFLIPAEIQNRLLVAIMLGDGHPLNDKKSLRMDIRREHRIFEHYSTFSSSCYSSEHYSSINSEKLIPEASSSILCMFETAVGMFSRFNASTICTVGEFERCVRPFLAFDYFENEYIKQTNNNNFSTIINSINKCKKESSVPCKNIYFTTKIQERDLPAEYRNTQDFVSRASFSFETFKVTELFIVPQIDIYQLFRELCLNLWCFAIAYLFWRLIIRNFCHLFNNKLEVNNRIEPKSPMIHPIEIQNNNNSNNNNQLLNGQQNNNNNNTIVSLTSPKGVRQTSTIAGSARQLPPLAIIGE